MFGGEPASLPGFDPQPEHRWNSLLSTAAAAQGFFNTIGAPPHSARARAMQVIAGPCLETSNIVAMASNLIAMGCGWRESG